MPAMLQLVSVGALSGVFGLFGVDRLMSTCTALTNMTGNTLAVFVIARWEKGFDAQKFEGYLAQQKAGTIDAAGGETAPKTEAAG
jgi:aerobic C4-dicarboxylate transport protein